MSPVTLSPVERRVLQHIRRDILTHGRAPTYDELTAVAGTKGSAHRVVRQLARKGLVVREPQRNRGLRLPAGADTYTIHLEPEADAQLLALAAARDEVPEVIIARALAEYLGRAA
ncbi:LexA family protein [Methylobacterium sp. SyP6R]|uniref:LexA family protein n=1 Tax=Methylobacterium sp. SyP6R TaxID=2718876 RepID=UPI001F2760FD|nr:hypothetical protein [Methylobacterium sp. SyP6R]MCF4125017.1 hypothetical protein [Methylobacterium sp. SyP6R]